MRVRQQPAHLLERDELPDGLVDFGRRREQRVVQDHVWVGLWVCGAQVGSYVRRIRLPNGEGCGGASYLHDSSSNPKHSKADDCEDCDGSVGKVKRTVSLTVMPGKPPIFSAQYFDFDNLIACGASCSLTRASGAAAVPDRAGGAGGAGPPGPGVRVVLATVVLDVLAQRGGVRVALGAASHLTGVRLLQ